MAKTFYKTLIKVGKFQIDLQRFNKGYKNMKGVKFKSGIRTIEEKDKTYLQICISNYRFLFIKFK